MISCAELLSSEDRQLLESNLKSSSCSCFTSALGDRACMAPIGDCACMIGLCAATGEQHPPYWGELACDRTGECTLAGEHTADPLSGECATCTGEPSSGERG